MSRIIIISIAALLISSCAPRAGYEYEPGTLTAKPKSSCLNENIPSIILSYINARVGLPGGAPSTAVDVKRMWWVRGGDSGGPEGTIKCYGRLILKDGQEVPGIATLSYKKTPEGTANISSVRWESALNPKEVLLAVEQRTGMRAKDVAMGIMVPVLMPGMMKQDEERSLAYEADLVAGQMPAQPPSVTSEWEVAAEKHCQKEGGNLSLCLIARNDLHWKCEKLGLHAMSTMHELQTLMHDLHATADQVVQANMGGINDWHPIAGPYWAQYPNEVSYSDATAILNAAVRMNSTMTPEKFFKFVSARCMEAK